MRKIAIFLLLSSLSFAQKLNYQRDLQNFPTVNTAPPLTGGGVLSSVLTIGLGAISFSSITGTLLCSQMPTLSGAISNSSCVTSYSGTVPANKGGTGQTSYTDGQLLIGDSSTGGLDPNTITAGSGCTVTNGHGSITISCSSGSSILLQTNGINNGSQVKLNLAQGGGISVADNGSGTVTIANTLPAIFGLGGDGSDGGVTADGTSTVTCLGAPSSSTYTMTRDCMFSSLTVNSGVTVKTNNFLIYGTGTCTNAGTISNNGATGSSGGNGISSTGASGGGSTASAGSSSAHYQRMTSGIAGTSGGNGATGAGAQAAAPNTGNNASDAVDTSGSAGASGNAGGTGGTGTSGAGGAARAGGTGGAVSLIATTNGHNALSGFYGAFLNTTTTAWNVYTPPNAGNGGAPGGGGGGGDGTNAGGGGGGGGAEGGGGGAMGIYCKSIVNSGTIEANAGQGGQGGSGFSPTVGNTGGGGGGAGGSGGRGGILWAVYQSLTNTGTIEALGGSPGIGGTAGSPHGTGTNNATNGSNGPSGPNGVVIEIQSQ